MDDFPRVGRSYKKAAEVSKEKPVSEYFSALRLSFSCHFLSKTSGWMLSLIIPTLWGL